MRHLFEGIHGGCSKQGRRKSVCQGVRCSQDRRKVVCQGRAALRPHPSYCLRSLILWFCRICSASDGEHGEDEDDGENGEDEWQDEEGGDECRDEGGDEGGDEDDDYGEEEEEENGDEEADCA